MTATIESLLADIRAIRATIHDHNVKLCTDMIARFDRRAAWYREQGCVELADSFEAKAAEWCAKLAAYKSELGI